jgi:hypothetical protein
LDPWLISVWEVAKVILPWLTGGVAGATLTFLLNQRVARRKQTRLDISAVRFPFEIDKKDDDLGPLQVSYKGSAFDTLLLYEFSINNISAKTAAKSPILIMMERGTNVVDRSSLTKPANRETTWTLQQGHECAYLWDAGELKPGDSARLRVLLSPTTSVEWLWRGDDDVDVTSSGREEGKNIEDDLRDALVWIAIYVGLSGIPFISGFAQGTFLLITLPYVVPYVSRWRTRFLASRSPRLSINSGPDSNVVVSTDGGVATVKLGRSEPTAGTVHEHKG